MRRLAVIGLVLLLSATALAAHPGPSITGVEWLYCRDGDTCVFTIAGWPPVVGQRIPVRLLGIDAPERRGRCAEETRLAQRAAEFLTALLSHAREIELREVGRDKYFRLLARIHADGVDVGQALLEAGLAREYKGGRREPWCPEGKP